MASLATGVQLKLGIISAPVRVESATTSTTAAKQICVGSESGNAHAPSTIRLQTTCPECGPITNASTLKRGRPVGDAFAIVEPAEIAALATVEAAQYKKTITLGAHPRDAFELETQRSDKLYYLVPDGQNDMYLLILELVKANPDLTFCGLWTPRSAASLFQLRTYERSGVTALVLESRIAADALKPVPQVVGAFNPELLAIALQVVPSLVKPLDMSAYDNGYAAKLDALFAAHAPVGALATPNAPTGAPTLSNAELLAALKASVVVKAPARKRANARPRKTA